MPEHGGPKCISKAKQRAEAQAKAKAAKEQSQGGDEDDNEKWSSEDDGKKKGKKPRDGAKKGAQKADVKQDDDGDDEASGKKGKKAAGEKKGNKSGGYPLPGGAEFAAGSVNLQGRRQRNGKEEEEDHVDQEVDNANHKSVTSGAIKARIDLEAESWVRVANFLPMGTTPELAFALGPVTGRELARLLVNEFWPLNAAAEAPGRCKEEPFDALKQLFSLVAASRRVAVLLAPLQKANPQEFNSGELNVSRGVQDWMHTGEPFATASWLWFDAKPLQLRYDADLFLVLLRGGEIRVVRREDWKRVASFHAERHAICFDFADELLLVGAAQGPSKLDSDVKLVKYDLGDPEMPGLQFVLPSEVKADVIHCLHLLGPLPNGGSRLLVGLGREGVQRDDHVLLARCGGKDEGVLLRIDASRAVGIQPQFGGNAVFCVAPHVDENKGQELQLWDFDDAIDNSPALTEGIPHASAVTSAVDMSRKSDQGMIGSCWPAVLARGCKSGLTLRAGRGVVAAAASPQLQPKSAPNEVEVSATLLEVHPEAPGHRELTAWAGVHMRENSLGEQLVVRGIELIADSLLLLFGSYAKSARMHSGELLLWAWHVPTLRLIAGEGSGGSGLSLGRAPFGPWAASAAVGSWGLQSLCQGLFAFGHYLDIGRGGAGVSGRGWAVVCEGALADAPKAAGERAQKATKNKSLRTSKDAAKSVKSRGAMRGGGAGRR